MIEERRKAPRKKIKESLKLDSTKGLEENLIEAKTIDLSKTGASCIIENYIPPFTKLKMMLPLPCEDDPGEYDRIECESVIVRVEPAITEDEEKKYKIALYFAEIKEQDIEKLDNFLKSQS